MTKKILHYRYKATLTYIVSVVLINSLFLYVPLITIFGTTMTPADITAGSIYVFRDFAQREIKHHIIFAMIIACGLSYFFANSSIALASFVAFSSAELIDYLIFTFTKKPLSERLLFSALTCAPIDSAIFCYMINSLHWLDFTVMTMAKIIGILAVIYYWKTRRNSPLAASLS